MSLRNKTCPSFLTPAPVFITIKGFNIVKLGVFINVLYQIILFCLNYSAHNIMFIVLLVMLICLCYYYINFSFALSLKSLLPSVLLSICFSFSPPSSLPPPLFLLFFLSLYFSFSSSPSISLSLPVETSKDIVAPPVDPGPDNTQTSPDAKRRRALKKIKKQNKQINMTNKTINIILFAE